MPRPHIRWAQIAWSAFVGFCILVVVVLGSHQVERITKVERQQSACNKPTSRECRKQVLLTLDAIAKLPSGKTGKTGKTGAAGETGTVGRNGTQGIQGVQGTQGAQGTRGAAGLTIVGPRGVPGPAGPAGPRGFRGLRGLTGPPGERGLRGLVGPQGPGGISPSVSAIVQQVLATLCAQSPLC